MKILYLSDLYKDKTISKDIKIFSLLYFLIPVALISGPAIPDILVSLIGLYFITISFKKKNHFYYKNTFTFFFLFFLTISIISSLLSDDTYLSLTSSGTIFYFRYFFFILCTSYLINNNNYFAKSLIFVSIICLIVVTLDGFYQYIFGHNIVGFNKFSEDRLTGLFKDEPIIGRYTSYLTIFIYALIYSLNHISKKINLLLLINLSFLLIFVFLTGERSPFFMLLSFFIILQIINKHFIKYNLTVTLFLIFSMVTLLNLTPSVKYRTIDLTLNQLDEKKSFILPFSEHHKEHYLSALKMFHDSPIFGVGPNMFRYNCNSPEYKVSFRSCSTHPHNYFIQVLSEIGLIGFIILFVSYICLIQKCVKILLNLNNKFYANNYKKLLFLFVIIIFFTPIIPHMNFYNNWQNILIAMPAGFLLSFYLNKKEY